MTVFITGATGFIGSHIAERLHEKGYRLKCLVRQTSDIRWIKHLPIEYVRGDIFDAELLKRTLNAAEYVYHVAGVTKAKTKEEYFRGNHLATRSILQAARSANQMLKRFIHVSSQAAVGPSVGGKPIEETTPFHPITTYGVSKMEAEKECLRMMSDLPITIVRPPAVYGQRDKDVFEFFNTMNKGIQPMIGFHDKHVSLVHVKDLVDGIILAGEHAKSPGQTYFISSERFYDWKEIGDVTSRVMRRKTIRVHIPEWTMYGIAAIAEAAALFSKKPALLNFEKVKDIVQNDWTCNVSKAMSELGYKEHIPLEEGVRQTIEWYRQQGWLK